MNIDPRLIDITNSQPYPLLFASISGAHLYGFPSADSDYDLRGVHILPAEKVVALEIKDETLETSSIVEGLELDLVTHDIHKFFLMLLKKNGYVLEQVFSPLIVQTTPAHKELKVIAQGCITRHHSHHYFGFADNQWKLFLKENPRRVKPLLYVFRVLLTGIHLMQTGEVEANLLRLNDKFKLSYIPELVERKLTGAEKSKLVDADIAFYTGEFERLRRELEAAHDNSNLPEMPGSRDALNDLLVRIRLTGKTESIARG